MGQDIHVDRGQPNLLGHVQAHHGQVKARLEHPVRRLRVPGEVGLRHRGHVPRRVKGAAHGHHPPQQPGQGRFDLQGLGQIGHPGQSHQSHFPGICPGHPDEEIPGRLRQGPLGRGGQFHAADAVGAVDVGVRPLPVSRQGFRGSHGHRHLIGGLCQPDQPQGVLRRLLGRGVAESGGDAHHPDIRTPQGKQDGDGVVDAGVGVDQNPLQHFRSPPLWPLRRPARRSALPGR